MQCLTVIKPSTFVGMFPSWLVPSGPTQMHRWKVWRGCGAMCRTVTMVTNVTNCHVTTHSVSPFPRLLKFSPPPLPSGASVLVSASDSEGGLDRAVARSVPSLGWHEGDVVTCPRQPRAWIKHLKSREFKYGAFSFCQPLNPNQLKKQTDADLRVCDIYATEYLDPRKRKHFDWRSWRLL